MLSRIIGGVLLIIGTSIGAGMLGLPVVTAGGGFYHSLWLFFGAWIFTVLGAFFILEVNLWLPEKTNLVSMAKITLGPIGQAITWISYLCLLYSLISAYTAGGADLLQNLLQMLHLNPPQWVSTLLFLVIFGSVVFWGIRVVDWTNRGLMVLKMTAYVFLISLVMPHIKMSLLQGGHAHLLLGAVMVVITSFGYGTIIPSLRYYFKSNVVALRITILAGSLVSLACYFLWDLVVQGTVQSAGAKGLVAIATHGNVASQLTMALARQVQNMSVQSLAHIFTSVCVTTSFLGVSLCLSDFLYDGFRIQKTHKGRCLNMLVTFGPPLLLVLLFPSIFILGLSLAGIFCVILLLLLPALMVFSGRYLKKSATGYRVWGGVSLVVLEVIVALGLLAVGVWSLL